MLDAGGWLPRRRADFDLLERLESLRFPSVGQLFEIHQGMRTGSKGAFLLSEPEFMSLPKRERKYFRRAAGQGVVKDGALVGGDYVFYPYAPSGPLLESEGQLNVEVPTYLKGWLLPRKSSLGRRAGISAWWLPTRPRSWQLESRRKLLSTYFGEAGSFAYDDSGEYVVVDGFAWLWQRALVGVDGAEMDFDATILPYAYLALLNSEVFERIVSCYSWRLQGGQMRLENRFVSRVPIPDLSDEDRISRQILNELASLGHKIHGGKLTQVTSNLTRVAREAYGVPAERPSA